jgi:hypothetical protein
MIYDSLNYFSKSIQMRVLNQRKKQRFLMSMKKGLNLELLTLQMILMITKKKGRERSLKSIPL